MSLELTRRQRMIELVRSGRMQEELARQFEPTAQSSRPTSTKVVAMTGLTTAEREELRRLRRENRTLRKGGRS